MNLSDHPWQAGAWRGWLLLGVVLGIHSMVKWHRGPLHALVSGLGLSTFIFVYLHVVRRRAGR